MEGYSLWVPSRNSSCCFVPTLRDACWQKHLLMVIWQPAISHRQTAEREQTGLQKSCCEGIREWKKDWGTCSGMVFVGLQIFLKESKGKRQKKIVSPSKRESKTMRGKGCAKVQRRQAWSIWILIGEGYFRPGIALALWQQIHKALASHQSLSHNWWPFWKQKQQLFSNPGLNHSQSGSPSIRNPISLIVSGLLALPSVRQVWVDF